MPYMLKGKIVQGGMPVRRHPLDAVDVEVSVLVGGKPQSFNAFGILLPDGVTAAFTVEEAAQLGDAIVQWAKTQCANGYRSAFREDINTDSVLSKSSKLN